MGRPRKGAERPVTGVYRRTYTDKSGTVHEYYQYVVYVPDATGKIKAEWKTAPTRKAAEEARAERKVDIKRGEAVSSTKKTVAQLMDEWLEKRIVYKRLEPTTVNGYRTIIETRIKSYLGRFPIQRLTPSHVDDFLHQLMTKGSEKGKGKPLSPRTVRQTLIVLSEAMKYAKRSNYIPRNPCNDVDSPRIEKEPQPQWNLEQAKRLLAALEGEGYKTLYILAITTGLRRSEVLGLRWEDVNLDEGTLSVRQKLTEVSGKLIFGKKPKTPAGQREVSLHPKVVELLREHRQAQREQKLRQGPRWVGSEGGNLVFCTRYGTPHRPSNVCRRLAQLLKEAGLEKTGMHAMRRTASTIAHDHSKDLLAVAAMLGHSSPEITATYYAIATRDSAKQAAQSVAEVLLG